MSDDHVGEGESTRRAEPQQEPEATSAPAISPSSSLAAALELAGDAVLVVDAQRRIVHCSQGLLDLTGRRAEELLGHVCIDALQCVNCYESCVLFETGTVCQRYARLIDRNGRVVHVVKNGRLLRGPDGRVTAGIETLQDISELFAETERLMGEADRLTQHCDLLRALAERTGDGLVTVDAEGRVTCLTPRAAELLGSAPRAAEATGLGTLFVDADVVRGLVADALRTGAVHGADGLQPVARRNTRLRARVAPITKADGAVLGAAVSLVAEEGRPSAAARGMVGTSAALRRLLQLVSSLARSDATVLITGESGTGKELVARALHAGGPRAQRPFCAINCATLSETLLESELFGHERGAFTGADREKAGRLEACADGTLLLDEVGCLPASTQAKLLRVLEQREFQRVGGVRNLPLRARIVAATNADLEALVREGTFREDLYYRLRVVPIRVPPLRERPEDVPALARHFLAALAPRGAHAPAGTDAAPTITPAALDALRAYGWPGNVRELRNAIEYALATGDGRVVDRSDLPPELRQAGPSDEDDRTRIERALQVNRYNRTAAAAQLGMGRTTLWRKMRQYGLA